VYIPIICGGYSLFISLLPRLILLTHIKKINVCNAAYFFYYHISIYFLVNLVNEIYNENSSSSSSSICHGVGPLVDPFRSHVSRSLFKGLPWLLLPVGE
jgi:hypothetical protein